MSAQPQPGLSPDLLQVAADVNACTANAKSLLSALTEEQVWQRPATGGWSIGECIEHLVASSHQMLPPISANLARAPQGAGPYKMDFLGSMLVWFLEPPYRMKTKAIAAMQPAAGGLPKQQLIADFVAVQDEFLTLLARASGRAIDRVKMPSPVAPRLKYNIYSAIKIIPAHQRRHLWQASQVKQHI